MRIALISDIHGNRVALDAVLASLERQPPDQIVCLGDVAATGPQPREVLAQVQALGCPVVMGNADAFLLNPDLSQAGGVPQAVLDIDLWNVEQLGDEERTFMHSFQPTVELPLDSDHSLLCYHGSPRHFEDKILPATPVEALEEMLAGANGTVLAGGHTHEPMVRVFGQQLLVNPGSVGLPRVWEGEEVWNPLWAEYAMLEISKGGELSVELRRVPVDFNELKEMVDRSDMPHAGLWLSNWR
jgi:putative phosphoesterase